MNRSAMELLVTAKNISPAVLGYQTLLPLFAVSGIWQRTLDTARSQARSRLHLLLQQLNRCDPL